MRTKNKISDYKLKKMLKEFTPKKVIYKHTMDEITLSSKQIDYLIKVKEKI